MTTQNIFDLSDTWNAGATTFAAIKMNVTDTASAAGSLLLDLQVGGSSKFSVSKSGAVTLPSSTYLYLPVNVGINYIGPGQVTVSSTGQFNWGSSGIDSPDLSLFRDAANTLAQRNGANAQTFRIYNTYTDASNYERGSIAWSSNTLVIGPQNAGTGSARQSAIDGLQVNVRTQGTNRWTFDINGHFLAAIDNTYDIGAAAATRPRNGYFGSNVFVGSGVTITATDVRIGSAGVFGPSSRSVFSSPSDGVMLLSNNAISDFFRLQFGGTTNSFGAIARDGAGVSIVGGAGGSTAHIKVPGVTVANLPAAATAGAGARSFVTDALAPVFGSAVAGSGAVKVPVYSDGAAWNVG
jgi:hypothetical protein